MTRKTTEGRQPASFGNFQAPPKRFAQVSAGPRRSAECALQSAISYPLSAFRSQVSSFSFSRLGFTLIELLVVILIIAVLAGLLLPAVMNGFKRAEVAQAKSEVKLIELAMQAYLAEYGKFPGQYNGNNTTAANTYKNNYLMLIATLRGTNLAGTANNFLTSSGWQNQNPRGRGFLVISDKSIATNSTGVGQYSAQSGELADPWGNRYNVVADWSMSGLIANNTGDLKMAVTNSVAVWSWGPDPSQVGATRGWPVKSHIYSWQ